MAHQWLILTSLWCYVTHLNVHVSILCVLFFSWKQLLKYIDIEKVQSQAWIKEKNQREFETVLSQMSGRFLKNIKN